MKPCERCQQPSSRAHSVWLRGKRWYDRHEHRLCADCGTRTGMLLGMIIGGTADLPTTATMEAYVAQRRLVAAYLTVQQAKASLPPPPPPPPDPWAVPRQQRTILRLAVGCPRCGANQIMERPVEHAGRLHFTCHTCESTVYVDITDADVRAAINEQRGR